MIVNKIWVFLLSIAHDLFGNQLLDGSFDGNILALGGSEVATHWFPETLGFVLAWAMNEQGVEENYISLFHL